MSMLEVYQQECFIQSIKLLNDIPDRKKLTYICFSQSKYVWIWYLLKRRQQEWKPPILASWQQRPQWQVLDKTIVLFDFVCVGHLTEILQRACCQWSGMPAQMTKTTPGLCRRDLFRNQKSTAAGWLHHSWALPFLPSSSLASERPGGKGVWCKANM